MSWKPWCTRVLAYSLCNFGALQSRESRTDAGTVALSYFVMLCYVAVALSSVPRGRKARWQQALVRGRASLGLAGVLIVAAAVVGSIGEEKILAHACTCDHQPVCVTTSLCVNSYIC